MTPTGVPPEKRGDLGEVTRKLLESFDRYRPQNTPRWNFLDAFTRLQRVAHRTDPERGTDAAAAHPSTHPAAGSGGSRGAVQRAADRWRKPLRHPSASGGGEAPGRDGLGVDRVDEGFDATLEAFRYLLGRVEALEVAAARRSDPVPSMVWLDPPAPDTRWAVPIATGMGPVTGDVWQGECGRGSLAQGLADAGLSVRAIEPRGTWALEAAALGLSVEVGPVAARLAEEPSGSLDAVVIAGVVDRTPIEGILALLELLTDRLVPRGPLVIVGTDPDDALAGRSVVAQDLLPGRPLHPETWGYLLEQAGFTDVEHLTLAAGGAAPTISGPGSYAVGGRRAR